MCVLTISTKNPSSVIAGAAECQVLFAGTLENISLPSTTFYIGQYNGTFAFSKLRIGVEGWF